MFIWFSSFISLPIEILQREFVIGSEKTTLITHQYIIEERQFTANDIILSISVFFRILNLPSMSIYRLKILAPNSVPFRF